MIALETSSIMSIECIKQKYGSITGRKHNHSTDANLTGKTHGGRPDGREIGEGAAREQA
jgi:hypothetical protein